MKSFLQMLLASILGVFISMFLVMFIFVAMMAGMLTSIGGGATTVYTPAKNTVLRIDLSGSISDRKSTEFMPGLFRNVDKSAGVDDIVNAIDAAATNDRIIGIYLKAGNLNAGVATLEPIRRAICDFTHTGKPVVAYGDLYTQSAYYVASAANKVAMNPQGMFMFHGMAAGMPFYKGMFDKIGIKYQVFRVGTFKAAVETVTETEMSEANRMQTASYVNNIWEWLRTGIAASRGIEMDALSRYADEYMDFAAPEKAVEYGLVDTLMYAPDVEAYVKKQAGLDAGVKIRTASVGDINAHRPAPKATDATSKVAVLYAEGEIVQGESNPYSGMGEAVITDGEYVKTLLRLKADSAVKAIVLRVNSPGGSAYASEQIWHAVSEVKKVKPVVVSMGNLAASGGYYISCAADVIVAEPTTLTGSIGGFAIIPEGSELFRKTGLGFDGVKTNRHSDMLSGFILPSKPLTDEERGIIQAYVNRFCDVFYTRCADGRSMTKGEIDAVGQGRVWTGRQAKENGLVDELGSLDDAVSMAALRAELSDYNVEAYPKKKDPFTVFMEELTSGGIKATLIRGFLGDDVYRQYRMASRPKIQLDMIQMLMLEATNFGNQ